MWRTLAALLATAVGALTLAAYAVHYIAISLATYRA